MIFLLIASMTGVVLSFAEPLDAALNRDLFQRDDTAPIDPLAAAAALTRARPGLIVTALPLTVEPGRTLQVGVAARPGVPAPGYDQVFVDRADGHVRGVRAGGAGWDRRHLVEGVFEFHFTLLAGTWGRWVMGVVALGWLLGNFVGVYLTLPLRAPFWRQWKRTWQMRASSPLPRQLLDLHRASALWLLGGVTILAFTSVCMNFFDEAFTPAVKALSPARPSLFDRPPPPAPAAPRITPAQALAAARASGPDGQPAKVSYFPEWDTYSVMFTHDGVENYRGLGPVSVIVGGADGRVIERDDPYTDSAGRQLSRALYPLHTGQIIGGWGVALDVLLGLATIEMIVTGVYLWLKRRGARVKARRARRAAA